MGHQWIADQVLEYLISRKNIEVTAAELMTATGKKINQIQGAVNNLRRHKGAIIVSPVPGRVFVYQGIGQAQNIEREDGSVVSQPMNAKPPVYVEPVRVIPPKLEVVAEETETRLRENPDNLSKTAKTLSATLPQEGVALSKGKFVMPRPHVENEFMRVVSRNDERVLLEDAQGKIWRATEI